MALDPSILFHGQSANPGAGYYGAQQAGIEGQQINNQKGMMQIQAAQDEQTKQQAIQNIARQHVGPDGQLDQKGFVQHLAQIDPMAAQGFSQQFAAQEQAKQKALMDQQKQVMDIQAHLATLDKTKLETVKAQNDAIGKAVYAWNQEPDPIKKNAIWPTLATELNSVGLKADPNTPMTPEQAAYYGNQFTATQRALQEFKPDVPKGELATTAKTLGVLKDDGTIDTEKPLGKALVTKATRNPSTQVSLVAPPAPKEGVTGQAALAAIPFAQRGVVNGIVSGRQSPPSAFAQKTPYWQGIMQNVYAVDPEWSEQRAQIRKAFTTGTDGRNIGALNTATVHLDAYLQAAEGLKNGSFRPGNALYNKISAMLGHPAPTTFEAIKNAVAGEQAAALKGSATDIEIHNVAKTMLDANSQDQFIDSGKASLGVMYQKLNTYHERYNQQIPNDTAWSPVLPSASNVFSKYGISAGVESPKNVKPGAKSADDLLKALGH